jgi:anion-transporting  ArsA/GET3 family ATPase
MDQQAPEPQHDEMLKRLDALRDEVTSLRERIEDAQEDNRRTQSRPFPRPDRRKAAA